MELQLQELLDRIKREGVEAARAEAEKIVADARERARQIAEEAHREAATIVERARSEAERAASSGRAALEQASRDTLLQFREAVQALLDRLVVADVSAAYGIEVVADVVPVVLTELAKGGAEDLAVLVPEAARKKLEDRFRTALAAELRKGVQIQTGQVAAGFRVTEKAGAAYYDFSAPAVAEVLGRYLNTRLAEILRDAAQGM